VPVGKLPLPDLDTPLSHRVRNIIGSIREKPLRRAHFPSLFVVKEEFGDAQLKLLFLQNLVEDRHDFGSGYVQFLSELVEKVNKGSY
jgi:hypothetical protein